MKMRDLISISKLPSVWLRILALSVTSGLISLFIALGTIGLADRAQMARFEALKYRSPSTEYSFVTLFPEVEFYLADINSYLFSSDERLYKSVRDSKAVEKLRARSQRTIEGQYASYWWLHSWNAVTLSHDDLLYYFKGWASLPSRSDSYSEYLYEEESEDEEPSRALFQQYGPDLSPRESFYSDPEYVNHYQFYNRTVDDQILPAIDHYSQVGAYPISQYYVRLANILNDHFNISREKHWAGASDKIMLLFALFSEDQHNLSAYDDFLFIYDSIRKGRWVDERIGVATQNPFHLCAVSALNAAYTMRNARPVSTEWSLILEEIQSAQTSCEPFDTFDELLKVMMMKAGIVILDPYHWKDHTSLLGNSERIERVFEIVRVNHEEFEPKSYPNLSDDAAHYMKAATEMASASLLDYEF